MRLIRKIFLIILLSLILIYVTNITAIPNKIVLFEGESYNLGTIFGIFQKKEKVVATSFNTEDNNIISEETVYLSLFNLFDVKNVNITIIENTDVIPLRKYYWVKTIFKWSISYRHDRNRR